MNRHRTGSVTGTGAGGSVSHLYRPHLVIDPQHLRPADGETRDGLGEGQHLVDRFEDLARYLAEQDGI